MKKQIRKAMLSTMAMLLVGVMSLTGVTYAWFTSNKEVKVDTFNVSVASSTGGAIMVAEEPTDDNGTLYFSTSAGFTPEEGSYLTPASSAGPNGSNATNKVPAFYKGTVVSGTEIDTISVSQTNASEEGEYYYYSFNLYFRNDGTETAYIALDEATTTFKVQDPTKTEEAFIVDYSALASRIAFVSTDSEKYTGDSLTNYTFDANTRGKLFEPNADSHRPYASTDYEEITGEEVPTSGNWPYKAVVGQGNSVHRYNNTTALAEVTVDDMSDYIVKVEVNQVAKVTVYIWIEGQDADCLNEVAGKAIQCNLAFTLTNAPVKDDAQ